MPFSPKITSSSLNKILFIVYGGYKEYSSDEDSTDYSDSSSDNEFISTDFDSDYDGLEMKKPKMYELRPRRQRKSLTDLPQTYQKESVTQFAKIVKSPPPGSYYSSDEN